jgi:hypothetical protein
MEKRYFVHRCTSSSDPDEQTTRPSFCRTVITSKSAEARFVEAIPPLDGKGIEEKDIPDRVEHLRRAAPSGSNKQKFLLTIRFGTISRILVGSKSHHEIYKHFFTFHVDDSQNSCLTWSCMRSSSGYGHEIAGNPGSTVGVLPSASKSAPRVSKARSPVIVRGSIRLIRRKHDAVRDRSGLNSS